LLRKGFPAGVPLQPHPIRAHHPNGAPAYSLCCPVSLRFTLINATVPNLSMRATEPRMTPQEEQQQFLSRLFLWMGIFTMLFIMLS